MRSQFLSPAALFAFFVAAIIFSLACFAVEGEVIPPPTQEQWSAFLEGIGGLKGAGTLAIVAVIVQGLSLVLKLPQMPVPGKTKLVIVTGLTFVGGVLALKLQGLDWASVVLHSTTLSAFQVFAHQIYKQFVVKNE